MFLKDKVERVWNKCTSKRKSQFFFRDFFFSILEILTLIVSNKKPLNNSQI